MNHRLIGCDFAGAVFSLLCQDSDQQLMGKIEQYYNIQVPEVRIIIFHVPHSVAIKDRQETHILYIN